MDIAATASALSQSQLQSQVSTAVARKSLDAQQQQGQAALQLLEAAADIQANTNASPRGVGASVDIRA